MSVARERGAGWYVLARRILLAAGFTLSLLPLFLVAFLLGGQSLALATPQYSAETGRDCTYCHRGTGGPLTPAGEAFRAAGYRLPGSADGDGGVPAPILGLPGWLHDLLRWLHLLAGFAWLGAIIFVHVVQTPRVAEAGIPTRYLKLAWPSIIALWLTGVLLAAGDIVAVSDLLETRWGNLLITKVALYALLVLVAGFVTLVLGPRVKRLAAPVDLPRIQEGLREQGRISVSFEGAVYDVTESKLWRDGVHVKRHLAYQDLTGHMGGAPHGPDVLARFPRVAGRRPGHPAPVRMLFALAYGNLAIVLAILFVMAVW